MTQGVLPEVPAHALAFAYRPYVNGTASGSGGWYQQTSLLLDPQQQPTTISSNSSNSGDGDDDCCSPSTAASARIVDRRGSNGVGLGGDRQVMARLHAQAVLARVREAKRLVDDERFEYACDVVLECQRGLHPMDPPPWCDAQMALTLANVHSFQLPDPSWQWVSPRWLIDMTQDVDEDGWQYASRFSAAATWHGRHSAAKSFVRRRRWLRLRRRHRRHVQTEDEEEGAEDEAAEKEDEGAGGGEEEEALIDARHWLLAGSSRRPPRIKTAASKIKSKVSGGYVGCTPRSPTSPNAKALAYTLKDGRYRSHAPKQLPSSPPPPPPLPPATRCRATIQDDLAGNRRILSDHRDVTTSLSTTSTSAATARSGSSDTQQQKLALDIASASSDTPPPPPRRHNSRDKCRRHAAQKKGAAAEPLPLPTGGFAITRTATTTTTLLSAAGSVADTTECGDCYCAGVGVAAELLPRLTALAPPEPTAPLEEEDEEEGELHRSNSARVATRPVIRSLVCTKNKKLGGALSSDDDGCGSTTVVASQIDIQQPKKHSLPATNSNQLRQRVVLLNAPSSSQSSIDYVDNDLPQLDPYVDPYVSLHFSQLPLSSATEENNRGDCDEVDDGELVDERLISMTADSLKQLLSPSPSSSSSSSSSSMLDRERLDILRAGLMAGGITAATIWYCLPWLHFELMQYDAGRQQLIAMLLSFSYTCPVDAPQRFRDLEKYTKKEECGFLAVQRKQQPMIRREKGGMSPSLVWRFVVSPLVARDPDLFYSDYKLMVVGVARWSLQKSQ